MIDVKRSAENPIIRPEKDVLWKAASAFNPSAVEDDGTTHLVYRAVSAPQNFAGVNGLEVSSVGYARSTDGVHFKDERQLIVPEENWEKFGCEDPRITKFEGRYYIFYTALSTHPFSAEGIKVGVAVTDDFKKFEKHLVTPFNAKAMALFPERVNGKIAALLTVNTDRPPAKICLALFDKLEDIWSEEYWKHWHDELESHVIDLPWAEHDQIEVGSQPLKTKEGWLIFYSYIYNYFSPPPIFGIQAALLDPEDPRKAVGEVKRPFLVPDYDYEMYGRVPKIVFPSGAVIRGGSIYLYYGAADTTSCLAIIKLKSLVEQLLFVKKRSLLRFEGNPIIAPDAQHPWEKQATFNPAAILLENKVHILYRAMSDDNTSTIGYAASADGFHIDERLSEPVYFPREDFEKKAVPGGNSGCEDPRLTLLDDTIYMCYTAFRGDGVPRVALTSITKKDFLARNWEWKKPILISPPDMDDKDAAIFPKKINGKYAVLHRLGVSIWLDYISDLEFKEEKILGGQILLSPRETSWDSKRIGICGPPIETKYGWLLLYHGISKRHNHYSVRAALLDLQDPLKVIYRTHDPIFEPKAPYERNGIVANVVFPCGTAIIGGKLFVYYGGADKVVGVATIGLDELVNMLRHEAKFHR